MRNILQYPITKSEVRNCLEGFADSIDYKKTGLVGDIRPMIMQKLLEDFDNVWYNTFLGQEYYEK